MSKLQESEASLQKIRFFPNAYWVKKDEKRSHKKMAAPCKRWGHGVVLYENQMYLFGGSGNNSNPRSWEAIYIMNCETFEWERVCPSDPFKGNIPEPRDSHSATRIGNNMYIFGGSNGNAPFNDMFAFNFTFRSWNKVNATGDIPFPREGHSAASLNDRYIFIYGGWNGKNIYNNYYLFDTMTNIWRKVEPEELSQEPAARESHSCSLVKDSFYIFGGQGHNLKKKENYFNDFHKMKLNFHKNMEKVTCHWEKIVAKNNMSPPHRTSHSACVYKDRYIFVIGGEGYSMENKDLKQCENEKKEMYSEKDFDDDKAPPCFPKNDVWIYDTDFNYWSLLEAKNFELLNPRFTHSCCVYKDQFIMFGGLKDYKNSIDDLIVLIIDDEDYKTDKNKKDIDLCNSCRRLFMVENESKTQRRNMSLSNEDLMLEGAAKETLDTSQTIANQYEKLLSAQKKPKQADIVGQYLQEQRPFIGLDSLSKISQMISWPFAGIGLLIDNARIKKATSLRLIAGYTNGKIQKKRYLNLTDDGEVWTSKEIFDVFMNLKFDLNHFVDYEQKDIDEKEKSHHELAKSQYSSNLKFGGFRLGDTLIYGSKTETSIIIGYMSLHSYKKDFDSLKDFELKLEHARERNEETKISKEFNSPKKKDIHTDFHKEEHFKDSEVLFASWGLKTDATKNDEKRLKILERLSDYFSEQELSDMIGKNTVLILDLKKIMGYEEIKFSENKNDIFYRPFKLIGKKVDFPYKNYIDFSLKKYMEFFLQTPQITPLKIFLNDEEIMQNTYADILDKDNSLINVVLTPEILECLRNGNVFFNTEKKIKSPMKEIINPISMEVPILIENQNTVINDDKLLLNNVNESKIKEEIEFIPNLKISPEKTEKKRVDQGILLYSESRLVGRIETDNFGDFNYFEKKWAKKKNSLNLFDFSGVIIIKDFLKMNVFKTVSIILNLIFFHFYLGNRKTII